jgi:hypothetical protein
LKAPSLGENNMTKPHTSFVLGLFLALISFPSLQAQTPSGQAPEQATRKITELVHAGRYAEAQQLTSGLLVAYPGDPRLIKIKRLLDKSTVVAGSANGVSIVNEPTENVGPAQRAANAGQEQLTGMEQLDYQALIELGRQAQQSSDVSQQKTLLQQFMGQSRSFLQKHPSATLVWQLRAASAISLNDPRAGYEAGQSLLAEGVADSTDSSLLHLLAQLKNNGWLDKEGAEEQAREIEKYDWVLGTWGLHFSRVDQRGSVIKEGDENVEFSRSESTVQAYLVGNDGVKETKPRMKGTVLDSGEIRWEIAHSPSWQPVLSSEIASDKRTIRLAFPLILSNKKSQESVTWLLHKN